MFDPYARIVYDYMGGMEDIVKVEIKGRQPIKTNLYNLISVILKI